ncbi:hypothetical protein OCS_03084 [Ophiocordyceps sinensis CO18]|uniref:Secreted protein n=1 Tax=Ophiocordyceps sinensis (strain Co18 / CGMCC 3.14243) TaxID=911162 RepID=T5AH97_OPHSC|nr:hypothetical protein OCS_03084 [Ophiocordyceps sinensis CO18]
MRALTSVGVLIASGFLHQSTAQVAGYGSPDVGSGANSYGEPDNGPQDGASATVEGLPGGSPGGSPGGPPRVSRWWLPFSDRRPQPPDPAPDSHHSRFSFWSLSGHPLFCVPVHHHHC